MTLSGSLKRADNSLRAATEGSLISQSQSQINGLVADFRRSVFSDNQRKSGALLGGGVSLNTKTKKKKNRKR